MLKKENGITLIALTITIIVLLIIASITIKGGQEAVNMSISNKLLAELDMVQHACLERYTEYNLTKDKNLFVGEQYEYSNLTSYLSSNYEEITIPEVTENQEDTFYYKLEQEDLEELGIKETNNTYIVNYKEGIVINFTTPKTPNDKPLYKTTTSTETN